MDTNRGIELLPGAGHAAEALEEIYRGALRAERAAWERLQADAGHGSDTERLDAWREAAAWADAARDAYLACSPKPDVNEWMRPVPRSRSARAALRETA